MSRPEPLCVYCRRAPVDPAWRPFCSERCKMTDLGRWLNEEYRVPDEAPEDRPNGGLRRPGEDARDD